MLSALLLVSSFNFPGGNETALIQSLGDESRKSVVVTGLLHRSFPKKTIEFDPADDPLLPKIESQLSLKATQTEAGLFLHDLDFSEDVYRGSRTSGFEKDEVETKAVNGKVYVRTTRCAPLLRFVPADMSKRVTCHWFFKSFPLAGSVNGLPEREFMSGVAACIGAKLVERSDEFYLDFDASQYRSRSIALLQKLAAQKRVNRPEIAADARYLIAVLKWLEDQELYSLMESASTDREVKRQVPENIRQLAIERVRALYPEDDPKSPVWTENRKESWAFMKKELDFEGPIKVIFSSRGDAVARYKGRTAPGGIVL